jgi:hypothetical protein
MNGYNIDTDAGIGSILSNFSTEYINHVIDDSLNQKFRPFDGPMPNMVDILERNFNSINDHSPDYIERTNSVRKETYIEIINKILVAYNLSFTEDIESLADGEIYGIARCLYQVFVSDFTDNLIFFFTSYIINNADGIYNYLIAIDNINRPKNNVFSSENFIDNKFALINANANMVIYNIAGYDISLTELLNVFFPNNAIRFNELLQDNGDIYKNHFASYIKNINTSPEVITRIKLLLQSRTSAIKEE